MDAWWGVILPTRGDQERLWAPWGGQGAPPGTMRGARGFRREPDDGVHGGPPGVTLPTRVLLLPIVELFVSESPWLGDLFEEEKNKKIGNVTDLVSRRPKTTLLPILVNAGGFIFSFRLEASLSGASSRLKMGMR